MTPARRLVAYVLPVHNEAAGIRAFHEALVTATEKRPDLDFEFVYVDDGSRDESLDLLLEFREADQRVTVIALARNFGHQIAVTAGLDAAAGRDAVVVMDTDLQDPPEVSLQLIETWESGADVAYAQRRTRRDSAFKKGTASVFYWMLTRLASIDIPRNVGDFRLMDRRVVAEVVRYREHDRFLRGIVAHVGFRQEAVPFDRDPRFAGSSSYPLRTMLKLAADGILGFSTFPLRLISRLGLFISFLSVLGAFFVRLHPPLRARQGRPRLGLHRGRDVPARRSAAADDGCDRQLSRARVRRDPGPPALLPGADGARRPRARHRMSTHIAAAAGEIAPVVLMPGDPLRARWIAETFLEDARCYTEVRGMLGFTGTWQGQAGLGAGLRDGPAVDGDLRQRAASPSTTCSPSSGSGPAERSPRELALRDVVIASGACTDSSMNRIAFEGLDYAPVADFGLLRGGRRGGRTPRRRRRVHVGLLFSSDSFYAARPELVARMTGYGVLAVEMEASALYTLAAKHGRRALAICTVSDHVLTGEETTAAEREQTFGEMVEIALAAALGAD